MRKKGLIIVVLVVGALGIGGYSIFQGNDQTKIVEADQTDKKQDDSETKEDTEQNSGNEQKSKATKEIEKMSDEEIKELINKGRKANHGEVEVTAEETELLRAIPPEKAYDIMGMTDDEVLGYINGFHQNIDTQIMLYYEGAREFNEDYLSGKAEFEWIKENYDFEKKEHKEAINEILNLIDKYPENSEDVLFALKPILWELNEELNPESLTVERANKLSLENAERIQNGQSPEAVIKVSH